MRRIVSLGLAASIVAFTAPAMAQDFLPRGNNGGHAMSGGGYATQGGGVAPGTAAQAGGFGGGNRGFQGGGGGRRGGFGGNDYRRYGGGGGYNGGYHRRGGYGGAAVGAGIAGLAAGALIGGAIANQGYGYDAGPGPGYYAPDVQPVPVAGDEEGYCAGRYRSYDPASGTYLGYDGLRHPCP